MMGSSSRGIRGGNWNNNSSNLSSSTRNNNNPSNENNNIGFRVASPWGHGHFMCCANHTFSGTTQDSCASDCYPMGE